MPHIKIKDQGFSWQVMDTQRRGGILDFHPYFHILHNQDVRTVSCARRLHFAPKEVFWYSFLLKLKDSVTWNFPRTPPGIEPATSFLVMRSWPTLAFPACAWTDFGETQRPLCRILKSNWVPPKQKAEPPSFDPICSVASKRERKMKKLENKKVGIQAV